MARPKREFTKVFKPEPLTKDHLNWAKKAAEKYPGYCVWSKCYPIWPEKDNGKA